MEISLTICTTRSQPEGIIICYLDQIINEFIGRGGGHGGRSSILPLLDFLVRDAQSDNARMIFGGAGKEQ